MTFLFAATAREGRSRFPIFARARCNTCAISIQGVKFVKSGGCQALPRETRVFFALSLIEYLRFHLFPPARITPARASPFSFRSWRSLGSPAL